MSAAVSGYFNNRDSLNHENRGRYPAYYILQNTCRISSLATKGTISRLTTRCYLNFNFLCEPGTVLPNLAAT